MATPEFQLHIAALNHINAAFIGHINPDLKFWHVPMETRDAQDAFWKKKMGAIPGVLDFQFGWPTGNAGVLELKVKPNKLTSEQNKFISWAHHIGWHIGVAYTVQEVHDILLSWGLKARPYHIIEPDYASKEQKFQRYFDMLKPLD